MIDSSAFAVNTDQHQVRGIAESLPKAKSVGGAAAIVTVPQFEFAGATLKDAPFAASEALGDVDGVIGQTILSRADVEYDLGSASNPNPTWGSKSSSPPPPAFGPRPMATVILAQGNGCEESNMAYWAKDGDLISRASPTLAASNGAPLTETLVHPRQRRDS